MDPTYPTTSCPLQKNYCTLQNKKCFGESREDNMFICFFHPLPETILDLKLLKKQSQIHLSTPIF